MVGELTFAQLSEYSKDGKGGYSEVAEFVRSVREDRLAWSREVQANAAGGA